MYRRTKCRARRNYNKIAQCVERLKTLPSTRSYYQTLTPLTCCITRRAPESLTLQNCKVLRIRSWKEARRARRPFGSLRTCRVTAQKLLNKRFALTYGHQTSRPPVYLHTYLHTCIHTHTHAYTRTRARTRARTYVHTRIRVYTYIRAEQRRYIGSNPAHSALMNMPEHGGSTLPSPPSSCFTPFDPGQSRLGYIVSGKG